MIKPTKKKGSLRPNHRPSIVAVSDIVVVVWVYIYHKLSWLNEASGLADVESRGRVEGQRLFPRYGWNETAVLDAIEKESHVGNAPSGVDDAKGEPRPSFGEGGNGETGQHLHVIINKKGCLILSIIDVADCPWWGEEKRSCSVVALLPEKPDDLQGGCGTGRCWPVPFLLSWLSRQIGRQSPKGWRQQRGSHLKSRASTNWYQDEESTDETGNRKQLYYLPSSFSGLTVTRMEKSE